MLRLNLQQSVPKKTPSHQVSDSEDEDSADVVDVIDKLLADEEDPQADTCDNDLDFLDNMVQDFEQDEKVGADINPKLATIVKSSFTKKLTEEIMKSLMDTYHRPKNCEPLVKVNPEIWNKMKHETRTKDLQFS